MSQFPTAFPPVASQLSQLFPATPTQRQNVPVRHLLLPFDGILTIDTTNAAKQLWDARDETYGEQPTLCEQVWLTGHPDNNFDLMLGSALIDFNLRRGYPINKGERLPPLGPLSLKKWWVNGNAGDRLSVFYYPPEPGTFVDVDGNVIV